MTLPTREPVKLNSAPQTQSQKNSATPFYPASSDLIQTSNEMIRVLIADDHPVVRSGLSMIIQYTLGIEAIAEASTGLEAVQLFSQYQPDVVLMDLKMPEMNGVEAIKTILKDTPEARIIVLTTYDGDEDIYRGLQAGAKGYLLKSGSRDELIYAIQQVHAGHKYIPAEVGARLAERMSSPQLTDRERQVLMQMCKGKSNQEIAEALHISEGTVKFHVNGILKKLEVSDRTQAVLVALRKGIANL